MNVASGSGLTNTAVAVKGGQGMVCGYFLDNTANTSATYFQFFDANTAVTVGTTAPLYSVAVPASGSANVLSTDGPFHSKGILVAATTTYGGATGPSTAVSYTVFYK